MSLAPCALAPRLLAGSARPTPFTPHVRKQQQQRHASRRAPGLQRGGARAAAGSASAAAPAVEQKQASPFAGLLRWLVTAAFGSVRTEGQLLFILKAGAASGQVPPRMIQAFEELYYTYKKAVLSSGLPGADADFVARVMASVCERVLLQARAFTDPYHFPSYHQRITEPYNYYAFGQRYVRGLVDFQRSVLGHRERFAKVQEQLAAGDNVADPACWALLLEATFPDLARNIIYVAGDRVVTDPLVAPFSMGRNLFCVHSKKHLDDVPELKAEKMATNRRTLKAMQSGLNAGGKLLWIAPSGGRDRSRDATDFTLPDAFDPSAVELMRALLTKAKPAGHLWPLAMLTVEVMPPPRTVDKSIGEERLLFHAPVGLSLGEELDVAAILEGVDDKEARQVRLAEAAFDEVNKEYAGIREAVAKGPAAAGSEWSQPWLEHPAVPLE
eukprot:scaffold7.g3400.t1